jgi:hypothetical protein
MPHRLLAFQPLPLIACVSLALLASAHIFGQHQLLKDSALYGNTHQLEKRQDEATCRNGPCSFLDSASACITQACICSEFSAAGNETVQTCETCIRPFDSLVADSLLANAAQCAFLNFSTNATTPTTIVRPTAAPVFPTDCNKPCSDITQAFSTCTGTDYSCVCSPVFSSGVACEQCLATVNAQNAEMLISIDIPSCFRLANPQPVTLMPNCFTGPCYPLIQATMFQPGMTTRCSGGSCICPGALAAGSSCLECLATLDPGQLSEIGEIVTSCQALAPPTTSSFSKTVSSGPTGATGAAASASPSNVFRSAAQTTDVPGGILFKGVLYFGLFLLILVLII